MDKIARIVALSSAGHGAEIGAVRLDEDPVHGAHGQHLQRPPRVFISDRPVKAQIPASAEQLLRHLGGTGIAVKNAAQTAETPHQLQAVPVRLPVVHDDRQVRFQGELHLAGEKRLLFFLPAVVPVVIQADLPDGDAFFVPCQSGDTRQVSLPEACQLLRVDADGGIDMGKALGKRNGALTAGKVAAGIDDQLHSLPGQRSQQGVPVRVKRRIVIMGMGVEVHASPLLCQPIVQRMDRFCKRFA